MFLFFDNPAHPGITDVEGNPRIKVIRCDAGYWPGGAAKRERLTLHQRQWYNANLALRWAREQGFEWIIHIDSDELLYCPGSFCEALAQVPKDIEVVRFRVYEAIPESLHCEHPFASIRYFRVGPIRPTRKTMPRTASEWARAFLEVASYSSRLAIAKILCASARGSFLRGHIGGKSAVRTSARIAGMGVHLPAAPEGQIYRNYFLLSGAVLHYDCSDFQTWYSKWTARLAEKHVPRNRDRKRNQQLRRFRQASELGKVALENLFREDYCINRWELDILQRLGLVVQISLERRAFDWGDQRGQ